MRIGIVTYFNVPNFGAQLQTLSTVGYLRRMGHDPVVINWVPADLEAMYARRVSPAQLQAHKEFVETYLPTTSLCRTEEEVVKAIDDNGLEAMIHGSDALFKYEPERTRRHFRKRKLGFVVNKPSISVEGLAGNVFWGHYLSKVKKKTPASVYAVSSQNCPYSLLTFRERRQLRDGLKNFQVISVRDEWTQGMVRKIMGNRCVVPIYPDPVFSLNQNCNQLVPNKEEVLKRFGLPEHYVLVSFWTSTLDKEYVTEIANELEKSGLKPVALPMPERLMGFGLDHKIELPLSPMDWYALIKYADGYIGERMHPIVVALHNAVPFFSFDEYGTRDQNRFCVDSSKTYHVVKKAGFEECYFAYYSGEARPSAKLVAKRIIGFDKEKCLAFSKSMQHCYEEGMGDLLSKM